MGGEAREGELLRAAYESGEPEIGGVDVRGESPVGGEAGRGRANGGSDGAGREGIGPVRDEDAGNALKDEGWRDVRRPAVILDVISEGVGGVEALGIIDGGG